MLAEANNLNPDQTASDQGSYCLQYMLPKNISRREENITNVVISGIRANDKECRSKISK